MFAIHHLILLLVSAGHVLGICHKWEEIDETCGMKAEHFNKFFIKPAPTAEILNDNCKNVLEAFDCLKDYNDQCVQGFGQVVARDFLTKGRSHIDEVCRDDDKRAEFMQHNQCFVDQNIYNQFAHCTDRWFHMTDQIKNIPAEFLIPASCCNYHDYQSCVIQKNRELCSNKTAGGWEASFNEMVNDMVKNYCANSMTQQECAKNFPAEHWKTITSVVEGKNATALGARGRFKSSFFIFVDRFSGHKI